MDIWGGENLEISFKVNKYQLSSSFLLLIASRKCLLNILKGMDVWRRTSVFTVQPCWTHISQEKPLQMAFGRQRGS
jgi:hypothetical protein